MRQSRLQYSPYRAATSVGAPNGALRGCNGICGDVVAYFAIQLNVYHNLNGKKLLPNVMMPTFSSTSNGNTCVSFFCKSWLLDIAIPFRLLVASLINIWPTVSFSFSIIPAMTRKSLSPHQHVSFPHAFFKKNSYFIHCDLVYEPWVLFKRNFYFSISKQYMIYRLLLTVTTTSASPFTFKAIKYEALLEH